ncbi:hypothetical protein GQ457_06G016850 [Hibiscus cannabinus]
MVGITRKIHKNPELGYEEFEISKLIRSELDKLGIPYNYPISVTGVEISEPPFVALWANMNEEMDWDWEHRTSMGLTFECWENLRYEKASAELSLTPSDRIDEGGSLTNGGAVVVRE